MIKYCMTCEKDTEMIHLSHNYKWNGEDYECLECGHIQTEVNNRKEYNSMRIIDIRMSKGNYAIIDTDEGISYRYKQQFCNAWDDLSGYFHDVEMDFKDRFSMFVRLVQ